jgi:hypothetical protein
MTSKTISGSVTAIRGIAGHVRLRFTSGRGAKDIVCHGRQFGLFDAHRSYVREQLHLRAAEGFNPGRLRDAFEKWKSWPRAVR